MTATATPIHAPPARHRGSRTAAVAAASVLGVLSLARAPASRRSTGSSATDAGRSS